MVAIISAEVFQSDIELCIVQPKYCAEGSRFVVFCCDKGMI